MKLANRNLVLSAAAVLGAASAVQAAPLVQLTVLGSTSASGPYTSSLQVTAGQTYYYEVQFTVQNNITTAQPVYYVGTNTAPGDGVNSIALDVNTVNSSISGITDSVTSANGTNWLAVQGTTAGTASGSTVTDAFLAQASGTFSLTDTLLKGSFVAGSAASDTLYANFAAASGAAGSIHFNASTTSNGTIGLKSVNFGSANSAASLSDPLVSNLSTGNGLVLTEVVPAPAVVPALGALVSGLGLFGFMRRRQTI
jgi:hypothetical protein